jgi:hypothetical protein
MPAVVVAEQLIATVADLLADVAVAEQVAAVIRL